MRRTLSATTALVTSFALAVPITFPASHPARAQEAGVEAGGFVCDPGLSAEDCANAEAAARTQQGGLLGAVGDAASEAVDSAGNAIDSLLGGAADTAGDAATATGEAVDGAATAVGETVAPAVEPVVDATDSAVDGAVTSAEELGRQLDAQSQAEEQPDAAPSTEEAAAPEAAAVPPQTQEQPADDASMPLIRDGSQGDAVADGPSEAAMEAATGQAEDSMATSDDAVAVDEVTETVTEDTARSSGDEFAPAQSDAQAEANDSGSDDTRFLQGALLGAAGALVVGALLNGNREVVSTAPDRVVVRDPNGNLQVLRDDDAILRQPGSEVVTRNYADGSAQIIVTQPDGSQVVTVRNAEGRVVKRVVVATNGTQTVLFDDTVQYDPVDVTALPEPVRNTAPQVDPANEEALRAALMQQSAVGRRFSLNQIRQIDRVRYLAPSVQVENITFATGSAAISPSEAQDLLALGQLMTGLIQENPNEVFLIEGHTDAIGSAVSNLTLSDRRAESVARALTEYFGVSPANMVLQGYGETDLRVNTQEAERANRRVVVRRVTPLLQVAQGN